MFLELSIDVIMPTWALEIILHQETFFFQNCTVFKDAGNKRVASDSQSLI